MSEEESYYGRHNLPPYKVKKSNLPTGYYNVVFHYNPHNKKWNCVPREKFSTYLNGPCFGIGDTVEESYENYTESI